jgi:hypothetical protein
MFSWDITHASAVSRFGNDGTAGDGRVTWQHALDFVAGINGGTYPDCGAGNTDWRLPNRREIFSLIHDDYYDPAVPDTAGTGRWSEGDLFNNVQSGNYWSSTTSFSSDFACIGSMFGGIMSYSDKTSSRYVWCVRGGH